MILLYGHWFIHSNLSPSCFFQMDFVLLTVVFSFQQCYKSIRQPVISPVIQVLIVDSFVEPWVVKGFWDRPWQSLERIGCCERRTDIKGDCYLTWHLPRSPAICLPSCLLAGQFQTPAWGRWIEIKKLSVRIPAWHATVLCLKKWLAWTWWWFTEDLYDLLCFIFVCVFLSIKSFII